MSPKIPDRWLEYSPCGTVIEGTNIVCFKVPLEMRFKDVDPKIERWNIQTLLERVRRLKAVIDLTNTDRYYKAIELKRKGVEHKKILVPGRILPPEKKVKEFMNTVDVFSRMFAGQVIGVHCTHGLNRTGYMVCRYMRDYLGIPPSDAIRRFEMARGYRIERKNYIAHLLGEASLPPEIGVKTVVMPINWRSKDESNSSHVKRDLWSSFNIRNGRKHKKGMNDKRPPSSSQDTYDFSYDY